jgi:manganese/iron transport system permease protein
MDALLLPFTFPFMRDAFLMAAILAVPAALVSCFLVLKGMSLMGDAISHAVLPGIAIAWLAGIPLALGALIAGFGCALLTGYVSDNSRLKRDTVMGVVFSAMFASGIVIIVWAKPDLHLDHVLFGNILGVSSTDLQLTGIVSIAVLAALAIFGRDLMLHAFDPVQARALGLPVNLLHYGLLILIASCVVASLQAVGIILSIALLIAPGATGFLVARRFRSMLAAAVATALFSGFAGVYLSFFLDSAPGPTIVLVMTALFIVAFIWSTRAVSVAPSA